ncbi:hypothetical protein SAMN05880570_4229 [Paenibacillus sp. RU4T]|nr:hypothetical protein SAMN05880555_4227 [Paenibacillus sp. RU4X]SIR64790.1 hypothetical protein SAMN05880570_4229 [Paenibacillus sp. RU4T]
MVVRRNLEPGSDILSQARMGRKLLGDIRISEVRGRAVQSRSRKVLLHTMSPDRMEFSTTLLFPVQNGYRLTLTLMLNRQMYLITGTVGSRAKSGNLYHYELDITGRSVSRLEWIRGLNDWLLRGQPARHPYKVHYIYRK